MQSYASIGKMSRGRSGEDPGEMSPQECVEGVGVTLKDAAGTGIAVVWKPTAKAKVPEVLMVGMGRP